MDDLSEEISRIINGDFTHESLDAIYALGGSSGGTRPKAHIHINDEAWIVKFPSSLDAKECGLLEYKANQLATKSNIRVNTFSLFPSTKGSGYFGAKRFDRDKQRRIHMISLSSLLETTHRTPNLDYSHLFQVVQKICIDKNEMYEAYRRMCFNNTIKKSPSSTGSGMN